MQLFSLFLFLKTTENRDNQSCFLMWLGFHSTEPETKAMHYHVDLHISTVIFIISYKLELVLRWTCNMGHLEVIENSRPGDWRSRSSWVYRKQSFPLFRIAALPKKWDKLVIINSYDVCVKIRDDNWLRCSLGTIDIRRNSLDFLDVRITN